MPQTKFNSFPIVQCQSPYPVYQGWKSITDQLRCAIDRVHKPVRVIAIDYYPGVLESEVTAALVDGIQPDRVIRMQELQWPEDKIHLMIDSDVTNDRIFGFITRLNLVDFFDPSALDKARHTIASMQEGVVLIAGIGAASVCPEPDILVYADMARWEIQLRMRKHIINNLGVNNKESDWALLYKQAFFVDWRVCDRWKKSLISRWDYVLDTHDQSKPKMVAGQGIRDGLTSCLNRPFSVVPFFDPGPWGGQWMKEHCNLDPRENNYAWCFNCVPEEESLLLQFGTDVIEIPSIDLVFFDPESLLGPAVYGRFGDEFPIRFDYLDTIGGGNLSLQVHPLTRYIQDTFGMHYTQDESYYLMDALPDSRVYLGLKEKIQPDEMITALEQAQAGEGPFDAEKYVESWPAKKHDHFLIPAGTVHCSGKGCMVLEISATPYIFTFKLWDWGRLGLDGQPRPINIGHGKKNIQWNRTTSWTRKNLVNQVKKIAEGNGWVEEHTGLHEMEFIETRRHWFTQSVTHHTHNGVNVICLIEGAEVIIESPSGAFDPMVVHYAETFIIPAKVGSYTIRPFGASEGKRCATLKAFVRTE